MVFSLLNDISCSGVKSTIKEMLTITIVVSSCHVEFKIFH